MLVPTCRPRDTRMPVPLRIINVLDVVDSFSNIVPVRSSFLRWWFTRALCCIMDMEMLHDGHFPE